MIFWDGSITVICDVAILAPAAEWALWKTAERLSMTSGKAISSSPMLKRARRRATTRMGSKFGITLS